MRVLRQPTLERDVAVLLPAVVVEKVYANASAGDPFVVRHGLGERPVAVAVLPFTACYVWSDEDDRKVWTARTVQLRCSVANAPLTLVVFAERDRG